MPSAQLCFEVDRTNPSLTRVHEQPTTPLAAGHLRLGIERVALTSNTVTYALFGDQLDYWGFYPCAEPWGRVPAIGWATVIESAVAGVPEGGRYFGWYPIARSVDVQAEPVPAGLSDAGAHRAKHAPTYRTFTSSERDPMYQAGADAEDRHALLRGLFLTGMLMDGFFAGREDFGAEQIIVLSASSKTAIAFAHEAAKRGGAKVVGLTSARNVEFVQGLGCYGQVLPYEAVGELAQVPSVSADMAGNGAVLAAVHERLGDRLAYSMRVGASHVGALGGPPPTAGPKPEMFFAPAQVQAMLEAHGPEAYMAKAAAGLRTFVGFSEGWLELQRGSGAQVVTKVWEDTMAGRISPTTGQIVTLAE